MLELTNIYFSSILITCEYVYTVFIILYYKLVFFVNIILGKYVDNNTSYDIIR